MVKANELRIGNYVKTDTDTIVPIRGGGINAIETNQLSVKPIPLTPEILEKCGFVKHGHAWNNGQGNSLHYCAEDHCLQIAVFGPTFVPIAFDVYYLHQLQNLYYALTGEELNVQL